MKARKPAPCPQCHPGPSADPAAPLCLWHESERVRAAAAPIPAPAPGPALPTAAAFAAVRAAAEAAVVTAIDARYDIDDAVNWADLGVTSVEWVIADADDERGPFRRWRVVVEEVASDAYRLQARVIVALADAGYPAVEVVTEW